MPIPRAVHTVVKGRDVLGASDGIRTRVYGFAGRCLASQPHPRGLQPCQRKPLQPSVFLVPIISFQKRNGSGRVLGTMGHTVDVYRHYH